MFTKYLLLIFLCFNSMLWGQASVEQLEAQLQKGISLFNKGNYAKAERIFDKLLEAEESYAEVYVWKGKCLVQFEEYQAAYEAFSTAKNLDPTHAPYWLELGKFKYELGIHSIKKPELCGDCGKFLIPDNSEMLQASDYYRAALKDYEKALQLDKKYAEAYFQTALAYEVLGDKTQACQQLQTAKDLHHEEAKQHALQICP